MVGWLVGWLVDWLVGWLVGIGGWVDGLVWVGLDRFDWFGLVWIGLIGLVDLFGLID